MEDMLTKKKDENVKRIGKSGLIKTSLFYFTLISANNLLRVDYNHRYVDTLHEISK